MAMVVICIFMNTSSEKNVHVAVDDRITVRIEVLANGCGVPIVLSSTAFFHLIRSKEDPHLKVGWSGIRNILHRTSAVCLHFIRPKC
jgi:nitrogen-specific signal transduction histidine kinase